MPAKAKPGKTDHVPEVLPEGEKLGPLMRAIKAVHHVAASGSTKPEDLARQRASQDLFARLVTPVIGIRTEPLTLGEMNAEWVRPEFAHPGRKAILYCHGGGYTCGSLEYARILAGKLALSAGLDVLSFAYRLAPEHPYPAAQEDAMIAWNYLMHLGYGARDVFLAGDSAGGNLALTLTLRLKELNRFLPSALILMSPWTDMTSSGESYRTCLKIDPLLSPAYIQSVKEAYGGAEADFEDPRFSPLFGDLSGMPPVLLQVGSNEILRSDSELLHRSLRGQGGFSRLEVYEQCWHVFQQMPTHQARLAMEAIGHFIRQSLDR